MSNRPAARLHVSDLLRTHDVPPGGRARATPRATGAPRARAGSTLPRPDADAAGAPRPAASPTSAPAGAVPGFLERLFGAWPSLRGLGVTPEARECARFYAGVRAAALEGRLRAQVLHVANEGHRSRAVGALLRAQGLIAGAPDYAVTGPGIGAVMEFKAAKGRLSPLQLDFADWCQATGTPHYVCRTAEEGWRALAELGALRPKGGPDPCSSPK